MARRAAYTGSAGTIDYRVDRPFQPATASGLSPTNAGLSSMHSFLSGLDRLMGGQNKLSETYFKIQEERQTRDAETSASALMRNKYMEMAKSEQYQGKGADNIVPDWEKDSEDAYAKWSDENPNVNDRIKQKVFAALNEQYLNRAATLQIGRQAEYDVASRTASVMEAIDSEALSPMSVQAYRNIVEKANQAFPNDPIRRQTLIDKGVNVLSGTASTMSPGGFVAFAKGNKDELLKTVGGHNAEAFLKDIRAAENQQKADAQYAWAQEAHAHQRAQWNRSETERNTMVAAINQWAQSGELPAPNTMVKGSDGSLVTLLQALGSGAGTYMNMFNQPGGGSAPVSEMRSYANEIMRTLPQDPKTALLNAAQLRAEGKIGDLELKQIQSQATFWTDNKSGPLQSLGSDRITLVHKAIDARVDPKLTPQQEMMLQVRNLSMDDSLKQKRTEQAIALKTAVLEYIQAQRALGVKDSEIDAQLSINNSESWLSSRIAQVLESLGSNDLLTPLAPGVGTKPATGSTINIFK